MKIYYSSKFAKDYKKLPKKVKLLAEKREEIFRQNPKDSRLKTHKLSGKLKYFWAFSIDYRYRVVFEFRGEGVVWFHAVGTHEVYR